MFPDHAASTPGFGAEFKKHVRDYAGAYINMGGFGEVLARYENYVDHRPECEGSLGRSRAPLPYQVRRQRAQNGRDMADSAGKCSKKPASRCSSVDRQMLTPGWSIHELGTARMGTDPKTSVVNQFQQSHDVKNLFVVDGSTHVSASNQNPTWTIMALCWRSCDYLADQMRQGAI